MLPMNICRAPFFPSCQKATPRMPYLRCGALSMALDGLTLFLAVPADDRDACCFQGVAPRHYVGGRNYIGLREHEEDALQRASLVSYQPVTKGTHMLLRVHFTPLGLAHYSTATAGVEHSFSPLLTKKLYHDDPTDWKVWHFHGDSPLRHFGPGGIAYLTTEWLQIL